jgi:hypothetical protein
LIRLAPVSDTFVTFSLSFSLSLSLSTNNNFSLSFSLSLSVSTNNNFCVSRPCACAHRYYLRYEACDGASMFRELALVAMISPIGLWMCPSLFREPHLHAYVQLREGSDDALNERDNDKGIEMEAMMH